MQVARCSMKPFMTCSRAVTPSCVAALSGRLVLFKSTDASATATATATATTDQAVESTSGTPNLVKVPSLPFLGSLLTQYSKTPEIKPGNSFEFWPEMRRRFGDFYSMGMPGLGSGSHGTVYILQDPHEFMRVLRSEGKYPTSVVQAQWSFRKYFEADGNTVGSGILGHGSEWKRIRSFLQTDLLSPQSAGRYVPGVIQAAEYVSRGAQSRAGDLNKFLNEASFDMFSTILLGDMPRIADPTTESPPEDILFCRSVANALQKSVHMSRDPYELFLKNLGIQTKTYKDFAQSWKTASDIAADKIQSVLEKQKRNELSELEAACYLIQAMNRHETDDSISTLEVKQVAEFLLFASVDTTSATLSWYLLHASQNEHVQERIHEELSRSLEKSQGKLTSDALSSGAVPYLHAFIRESNRVTSPATVNAWKTLPKEVEIHGVQLPAGTTVAFDGYSQGMDPNLVEEPLEFRPERWLPEAVQARKGTPSQILDHPLFSGPFSQGARRCPGSRVAQNEALVLMSQLILDWKMSCPIKSWQDVPYGVDSAITCHLPELEFEAR